MPLAKIHVFEGRYDEARIAKVSGAVQAALMNTLRVPAEDFFYQRRYVCCRHMQIVHRMRGRFVHPC
jgi:hypothetical protein